MISDEYWIFHFELNGCEVSGMKTWQKSLIPPFLRLFNPLKTH